MDLDLLTCRAPELGQGRLRIVYVSPELLAWMVTPGVHPGRRYEVTTDAIPEEHRVMGGFWDEGRRRFALKVWSPEFEPVPEGMAIPEMVPQVRCLEP